MVVGAAVVVVVVAVVVVVEGVDVVTVVAGADVTVVIGGFVVVAAMVVVETASSCDVELDDPPHAETIRINAELAATARR